MYMHVDLPVPPSVVPDRQQQRAFFFLAGGNYKKYSFPEISRIFGGLDKTTAFLEISGYLVVWDWKFTGNCF